MFASFPLAVGRSNSGAEKKRRVGMAADLFRFFFPLPSAPLRGWAGRPWSLLLTLILFLRLLSVILPSSIPPPPRVFPPWPHSLHSLFGLSCYIPLSSSSLSSPQAPLPPPVMSYKKMFCTFPRMRLHYPTDEPEFKRCGIVQLNSTYVHMNQCLICTSRRYRCGATYLQHKKTTINAIHIFI